MKVLSKVQLLAERNGWSLARAQGFVDGELSRRRGTPPSTYARVGIDEYCLGFRAGYYERGTSQTNGAKSPMLLPKGTAVVSATASGVGSAQAPVQELVHLDNGRQMA